MRVGRDTRTARPAIAEADHRAPFGKARAHAGVFGQACTQSVQTLGHRLPRVKCQVLGADVDLDPGDDARRDQTIDEAHAARVALPDRLVVKDCAADAGAQVWRRHQQFTIRAPRFLGLRYAYRRETPVAGRIALVHREQAAASRDQLARGVLDRAHVAAPHVQSRISGRSFPCLSM